jgi:hypothetical protein
MEAKQTVETLGKIMPYQYYFTNATKGYINQGNFSYPWLDVEQGHNYKRRECGYCHSPNPVDGYMCSQCGAPL